MTARIVGGSIHRDQCEVIILQRCAALPGQPGPEEDTELGEIGRSSWSQPSSDHLENSSPPGGGLSSSNRYEKYIEVFPTCQQTVVGPQAFVGK